MQYHKVITVDFSGRPSKGGLGLTLSPNPAQDQLSLKWAASTNGQNATIQLFDLLGRQLASYTKNNSEGAFELPVAKLSSGVYIVKISQNGVSESLRFLKD